ncbi:galactokinase [Acetoanaerobium pronyense]|uniref:Galactokinase n=1 Tax=Acetoanaerobium pronyense TaxID=1482736 RepID=A0ABS4KGL8_9FIRM|nr:galactokinase [Acetoanaerobium pronyense]MBP2026913.1 galactokinase [Acetoanaerobium pronyense]
MEKRLIEKFKEIFEREHPRVFFAPGRVNLIGEYTDFNNGHVFPCALDIGTYCIALEREDKNLRFYSQNFPEMGIIEISLADILYDKTHDWANYPKSVIYTLIESGYEIKNGMDFYYYGNIPNGAGLSSSASIEMVTGVALNNILNLDIDIPKLATLCQRAENKYIGVNSGIMDQFAIGMGKKDCAILLDCKTLEFRYSRLNLMEYSLIISNTNKRRGLADSKYNERRNECEGALLNLKEKLNISALGEVTIEDFEKYKYLIKNKIDRQRAEHVVYENARTLDAVNALEKSDLHEFGRLMNQSHQSLKEKFEVTGKELDTLVELSQNFKGVIGSRMTGAGFGGCTVTLVLKESVEDFIKEVGKSYKKEIGYAPDFYIVSVEDGAKEIF